MARKNEETPEQKQMREATEKIALNIQSLADGVRALIKGPLNRRALVLLLASSSSVPQNKVGDVLKALETLDIDWLNKK